MTLYLYPTFQNLNEDLEMLQGTDGLTWTEWESSYTPTPGHVVRDPYMLYRGDKLWLAHTNITGFDNRSDSFDIAYSRNGHDFTFHHEVDCSDIATNTLCQVWSPTWFVDDDDSVHIFVTIANGSSAGSPFQVYEYHPLNEEMTSWSTGTLVTGTSLKPNMIGPYMVKKNGVYHLWYKDEDNPGQTVEYMSSTSLLTGYTITKQGNWAGWGTNLEGPVVLQLPNGNWRCYMDAEGAGVYYAESSDDWATWSSKTLVDDVPFTPVNGGVMIAQRMFCAFTLGA